jgi:tetratricopeptide (TPR) repeat protein
VRELAAQLLGPRCLDVAQSYSDIGCAYNALGQHDKALEFHSKAFIIQRENLGPRNKYLAATCNCIGIAMAHHEDVPQAFAHYITALDIRLDEFPYFSGSSDVACSLDNIGSMLKLELEIERALLYFAQSLEVQFETLGPRHMQQATTFINIADAYQKMLKTDQALECVAHEIACVIVLCSVVIALRGLGFTCVPAPFVCSIMARSMSPYRKC